MVLGEVEDVQIRFLLLGSEKYLGKGKDVYFAILDLEIELIEMQCGMF